MQRASQRFLASPSSIGEARHFVRECVGDAVDEEHAQRLVLAVSELATLAVLGDADRFEVHVALDGTTSVAVHGAGDAAAYASPRSGHRFDRLHVVAGVCDRWGVEEGDDGQVVAWCEVDRRVR